MSAFPEVVWSSYLGWEKSAQGMSINRSQTSKQFIVRILA